jgi:hypothetical protein
MGYEWLDRMAVSPANVLRAVFKVHRFRMLIR